MERLPRREREALLLSAMDELSTAEIGLVLGKSESSVRSLLFRARAHLRERLKD
jgi:RNA polymerase sigma-70 factor, ECF subfamily